MENYSYDSTNVQSENISELEKNEFDENRVQNKTEVAETSPKGRFSRYNELLGRGAYKLVYKGIDHETGCEVAWNTIELLRLPPHDRVRIRSEIDLIKKL